MINNQNHKKFFLIFVINTIFFICLIIIANFFIGKNWEKVINYKAYDINQTKDNDKTDISKYETEPAQLELIKLTKESYKEFCGEIRIKFGENYTKKPVVVLGCSYAYGHGLKKEESFSYLLSEISQRPVYNFSKCCEEAYDSICRLENSIDNLGINKQIENAEYYIYVYMHDHIDRYIKANIVDSYLSEKFNNPKTLNEKIYRFLYKIPICRLILLDVFLMKLVYDPAWEGPNIKNCEKYLKNMMLLIKSKIYTKSPNAKMIIIIYDQKIVDMYKNTKIKFDSEIINSKIWDELQNEYGIKIVHTKDITGIIFDKEYKLKADIADWHPNAKAWEVFTPKFTEKYIK